MRVAIEAASLALSSGGLARYTSRAVAWRWRAAFRTTSSTSPPTSLSRCRQTLRRTSGAAAVRATRSNAAGGSGALRARCGRLSADLIHGPDFAVPYIPARPSVLTLHDLSPWMDQDWHADAHRVRRRTPILLEMGVATMIITPSELVRKQAIERFRLRPDRVVAIPEAAAPWFAPVALPVPASRRYFLFVGTLEPRKNLPTLLEAWREVRRRARDRSPCRRPAPR